MSRIKIQIEVMHQRTLIVKMFADCEKEHLTIRLEWESHVKRIKVQIDIMHQRVFSSEHH